MAMTPEEQNKFNELERLVHSMRRGEDVVLVESIKNRLDVDNKLRKLRLNDLFDVNTEGVTNGQVIKYATSTTTWVPANDNT